MTEERRVYWSDRDGNPPPANCTFHFRSFSGEKQHSFSVQPTKLPPPGYVKVLKKTYSPTREQWIEGVEKALDLIQKKKLKKVVLARICTLELEIAPDPFAMAAALKQKSEGAFVFCVESEGEAFLGATPERLFRRTEQRIQSEAMAGTRPRGKTMDEDRSFSQELLSNGKLLREFHPVQNYLQKTLAPFCSAPLLFSPISIHKTQNVQHLYSSCTGELKQGTMDEEIICRLHPTPALCGIPKEKAFSVIQELEPFERGLYGGTIGWTTENSSEWIVGIRSCRIKGKIATLFSGTGIVEGSQPEEEWEELNQKIKLYDGILDY